MGREQMERKILVGNPEGKKLLGRRLDIECKIILE